MLNKMKRGILSLLATMARNVGLLGVQPACVFNWYQPEVPAHLRDN